MVSGAIPATLRKPDRLYIGGEWVRPSSDAKFDVIQPATEELFLQVVAAQKDDMKRAVSAARLAFDRGPWPRMTHSERAEYMRAIGTAIRDRSDEFSRIWTSQMGILYSYARAGTPGLGGVYDYYAGFAESFPFTERHQPTAGGNVGLLLREPVGVVGAIIPWNSPLALIAWKTAPALIAGCTIVIKAAPEAPGEAYLLAEIAEAVGIPAGVINVVTADRDISEVLVRDKRVDKITFTGSTVAGRRIGSILGERIARFTLELGGKSPAIILDDYDVAVAAKSIAESARSRTGQACSSLTRVIVSRNRHDELVDALVESFSKVKVGDPFDSGSEMGPLAMRRQLDRVLRYVAQGQAEGATLATGGKRPSYLDRGYFMEPTVFANVDNSSTIAQEEIFGPVLCVIPATSEENAIEIANDTAYGLNASVFTLDEDRAFDVARQLRSGTIGQNAFRSDFGIAFGGFKQSGIGREGGREGLLPFLETKTIILDAEPGLLRDR
jgi:aldehyde dehydrogenase (NAD+)